MPPLRLPVSEPTLLAIDAATETLALALVVRGRVVGRNAPGGAQASQQLLPALRLLLDEHDVQPAQIDALAFGRGPGAFTGLRTACAAIQGLALGWQRPVMALDSLLLVAEGARSAPAWGWAPPQPLWVAMDARMGEIYAGCWQFDGAAWQVVEPSALWTLEALNAHFHASSPAAVAGNACTVFGERLGTGGAPCLAHEPDRGAALGRLALEAWKSGAPRQDAAEALPLYLRDKVALTTAERAAMAGVRG